ncbi:MAG: Ig-like domain-containing protein [Gemmatimonadaceae bacterium]|nr:Ig-like domain-containing protein [Gemmatimonadaceae bacterium]
MRRQLRLDARGVAAIAMAVAVLSCHEVIPADSIVSRVELSPIDVSLLVGRDTALRARVQLGSGTFLEPGGVFWSSADPAVASVDAAGRVSAVSAGSTRIAASAGGKSALALITVAVPPITIVRVAPASSGVTVGSSVTLRANALLSTGDTVKGRPVAWRTSASGVATVSTAGAVQAMAPGSATITATVDGVSGTATISVTPVPVAAVAVTPARASVIVTNSAQLAAATQSATGAVLTGRVVTWSTDAPTIATVSTTGLVTTLNTGTATITATSEGRRGTSRITVLPIPVRSVSILPTSVDLLVGATARLTAVPRDSAGTALPGRRVSWSSSQPSIATVDSTGLAVAVAPGVASITATAEGRSASSQLTATLPPVAAVTVAPATLSMSRNRSLQFVATPRDAHGQPLTGRVVTWLSGSPSIARVDANGLVTSLTVGTVLIIATSEGQRGIATVTVR